jgi:2-methylcitrate dehydratase PrpD
MLHAKPALESFADWASSVSSDDLKAGYERAGHAILDTLACMVSGQGSDSTAMALTAVGGWGQGDATVVGHDCQLPAPFAAVVNAASAHCQDWDDHELPGQTHPSAVLVPAVLALGEERGLSGVAVLDAYVVGLEAIIRIGEACGISLYSRGWHATSTIGAIGAAAACARLLGLDSQATAHALGLSISMASGFINQFGTTAKHLHCGLAAKAGIMAAGFAQAGFDASHDGFDGTFSLLTRMAGEDAPGFSAFDAKLGKPLAIIEHGVVVKRYPSCGCTQRIMDGVEDLRAEHGFTAGDVVSIIGRLPAEYMAVLQYERPQNAAQARFCMEYCVAAQLLDGALSPEHFTPESLLRTDLASMMPHITKAELCEADGPTYSAVGLADEIVEIALTDGRNLRLVVRDPVGSPSRPLSQEAFEAKARRCFSGTLQEPDQDAVIALCGDLAHCDQVGKLMRFVA